MEKWIYNKQRAIQSDSLAKTEYLQCVERGGEGHIFWLLAQEAGDQLDDSWQGTRLVALKCAVAVHEVHGSEREHNKIKSRV